MHDKFLIIMVTSLLTYVSTLNDLPQIEDLTNKIRMGNFTFRDTLVN